MAEQEHILDHLDTVFQDMESNLNGKSGSLLHDLQKRSFKALKEVQFPDRTHEEWKHTSVQKLITPKYKLAPRGSSYKVSEVQGLESYIIPVVNGMVVMEDVDPALKMKGINISFLPDALSSPTWSETFSKWFSIPNLTSNRAFELLNFAFNSNAFFLNIPNNLVLDKPIEIRILHDDADVSFSHPAYFIHGGAGSSISLFERFEKNILLPNHTTEGLINALGYIHLEKNARVKHIKWQDLPAGQNLVYKLLVTQERDSHFETLAFDFGGLTVRNNIDVELEESNTYTSLQAGYLAKGFQSMDHQTRINHLVPHGESHELYKGIIDGQASAAFNGKVYVHPDAQKTNAYQQNDTLVLSKHALMNSKPQLEIYADDVKCSHGATIGQMDEKALFYLRSRGLDSNTAAHILKSAFLTVVLDCVSNDHVREYIRKNMSVDV
jgi:Fe-S cluster assembly protein SufD